MGEKRQQCERRESIMFITQWSLVDNVSLFQCTSVYVQSLSLSLSLSHTHTLSMSLSRVISLH